ncbi:hypothetical protein MRX96_013060 [Rhipicephalus microplus]
MRNWKPRTQGPDAPGSELRRASGMASMPESSHSRARRLSKEFEPASAPCVATNKDRRTDDPRSFARSIAHAANTKEWPPRTANNKRRELLQASSRKEPASGPSSLGASEQANKRAQT